MKDYWVPLMSLAVALSGVFSGAVMQFYSEQSQTELKTFEVTFIAKQEAYAAFMASFHAAFTASVKGDSKQTEDITNALQIKYFALEPFLSEDAIRQIRDELRQYIHSCNDITARQQARDTPEFEQIFTTTLEQIRTTLRFELFYAVGNTRIGTRYRQDIAPTE
jgi:hypothetical protein